MPWWGLQLSTTFQSLPGPTILELHATNAEIRGTLGRNSRGLATAVVPLVQPGTLFGDRLNQLDFRLAKIVESRTRLQRRWALQHVQWEPGACEQQQAPVRPDGSGRPRSISRLVKLGMPLQFCAALVVR